MTVTVDVVLWCLSFLCFAAAWANAPSRFSWRDGGLALAALTFVV